MLPSQAFHRPEHASGGAVCLAGGAVPRRGERGAVLVHVAVATVGLLAFASLSIDLGAMWVARAQAQNAADAAALAGGIGLAYVSPDPAAATGAAQTIAQQHSVWGQPLTAAAVATTVGPCPAGAPAVSGDCMTLTITPPALPVFFSRIFGAAPTAVHASATAKVLFGNAATCVRPLAMPDRWQDNYDDTPPVDGVWRDDDLYAKYDNMGRLNILPPRTPDAYIAPSSSGAGTGITVADFAGVRITRRVIDSTAGLPLGANQMVGLNLLNSGSYEPDLYAYEDNLAACPAMSVSLGATVPTINPHREFYTTRPLSTVIASDSGAYWDAGTQSVRGSAFPVSPRLLTIALFDPDHFTRQNRSAGGDPDILVTNLVGFFVESVVPAGGDVDVTGVVVPTAGSFDAAAPTLSDQATFLRTVALVR
jgi:hypothetical protein